MMKFDIIILFSFLLLFNACGERDKESKRNEEATIVIDSLKGKALNYDLEVGTDSSSIKKAEKIKGILKKFKGFNGSILVSKYGKIIFDTAIGYSNFSLKDTLSLHSSFHLASLSKQFTAMAIMILRDRGKLDFDDPVVKYIPDIPYQDITIRQLMNHTSGVPNIINYIPTFLNYWDSCELAKNSDIVYMLQKSKPRLQFKPGKRFLYSNTGYILLAVIVEQISQMPFEKFLEENIFIPVQMKDTKVFSAVNNCEVPNRVFGYGVNRWAHHSIDDDDIRNGLIGDKGVYSSIIDLYKWDQALYTDLLVNPAILEEAFQYGTVSSGRRINYGFGWRKSKDDSQIVYHFGHWRGFKACIVRFTTDKNLIIILNNTGNKRIKHLARAISNVLYEDETFKPKF
jgi:CubicO group peptidase (beta-lactamase class C family)